MPNELKHVTQMNGVFVMDALHTLKYPATLYRILRHIGKLRSIDPAKLRDQIEEVVENGVKNGFIKKTSEGRFFVASTDEKLDDKDNMEEEEDGDGNDIDENDDDSNEVDKTTYSYTELSKSSFSNSNSEDDCSTTRRRRKRPTKTRKNRSRSRRRCCK